MSDKTLNISHVIRFLETKVSIFYAHIFSYFSSWLKCHASSCLNFVLYTAAIYIVLMKWSHLFAIGWSEFWLDSLTQNSIAQGDGNISAIQEVLTRNQSLAYVATLNHDIMYLCLGIFKDYQAIVDWVAKRYPNMVEVRFWHKGILMKGRNRKSKRICPSLSLTHAQWKFIHMHSVTCHEIKCSDALS